MRTVIISFLLSCLSNVANAQIDLSQLCGKTWQVDEVYIDSIRVDSTDFSSLKLAFQTNNQFTANTTLSDGSTGTGQGSWASSTDKTKLTLASTSGTNVMGATTSGTTSTNTEPVSSVFEMTYLDQNVLAFVIRTVDSSTGQDIVVELRLRPISNY